MNNLLVITAQGKVIDKSASITFGNVNNSHIVGNITVGGSMVIGARTSGQWLTIGSGASGANWVLTCPTGPTGAPGSPGPVGPRYISAIGGVLYKDQKDEKVNYQAIIHGSFSNM